MEWIEHRSGDKTFFIPNFGKVTEEDIRLRIKADIFDAIWVSLVILINEESLMSVPSFALDEIIFDISRADMEEHINSCIEHYVSTEEYEKCKILNDYLKDR